MLGEGARILTREAACMTQSVSIAMLLLHVRLQPFSRNKAACWALLTLMVVWLVLMLPKFFPKKKIVQTPWTRLRSHLNLVLRHLRRRKLSAFWRKKIKKLQLTVLFFKEITIVSMDRNGLALSSLNKAQSPYSLDGFPHSLLASLSEKNAHRLSN